MNILDRPRGQLMREGFVNRREIAFLLIGLGVGLMFAIAAAIEILLSLSRVALISNVGWDKLIFLVPFLLLVTGLALLIRRDAK